MNFSQGQFSRAYSAIPFERMFYFYRLIPLYTLRCSTLTPQFCVTEFWVCCRVLGFHRLITSQHSSHTSRCLTLTPRFFFSGFGFVSEFRVCCQVLGFHRLITSQHSTHTPRCSTLTPRFFVPEFWVCCRVLGCHGSITDPQSTGA